MRKGRPEYIQAITHGTPYYIKDTGDQGMAVWQDFAQTSHEGKRAVAGEGKRVQNARHSHEADREKKEAVGHWKTVRLPERWPPPRQVRAQDDLITQQADKRTAGTTTWKHKMEGVDHLV